MDYSAISTLWVLLAAALVFFMQAGFAMVETGFTRAKNAGNIIMKNVMDFCLGTPLFWLIGFGLMFGLGGGFVGGFNGIASVVNYGTDMLPDGIPFYAYLIFQTVFCATAATIVSGALAERTKFSSYLIVSAVLSGIIYPVSGHWIWGGGWLATMGFHDFAGSTAVHLVGGVAAFCGALIVGPRIGKYSKDGESNAIPGHNLTLGALGVFILWFAWFGFNGGSTVSMEGAAVALASKIFVTTNLAAAVATVTVMALTWFLYKKPDISMTLNGVLAGLVAITAGCDTVTPVGAAMIGILAGITVVFGIEFIDKKLKVDDPVGAVGVHGLNGILGTLLVGLFSDGSGTETAGLFYGGGFSLFGIQLIGVVAVLAWVAITMSIVFIVIKKTMGLRVSAEEEILGLDNAEHGIVSSYADFMPAADLSVRFPDIAPAKLDGSSMPVSMTTTETSLSTTPVVYSPLSKITIICNQSKFEELKEALNELGIAGITVSQILGAGVQKGAPKYYRGTPLHINLLPKVKIEIIVNEVPVNDVIKTARKVLNTDTIGDGKIFIYDVRNAVKIRTGEEGPNAI